MRKRRKPFRVIREDSLMDIMKRCYKRLLKIQRRKKEQESIKIKFIV